MGGLAMLFRKKIQRSCAYCVYGAKLEDGQILCTKKGVRYDDQKCFRFRYDPCKRIPPYAKAPEFEKYTDEDFKLWKLKSAVLIVERRISLFLNHTEEIVLT